MNISKHHPISKSVKTLLTIDFSNLMNLFYTKKNIGTLIEECFDSFMDLNNFEDRVDTCFYLELLGHLIIMGSKYYISLYESETNMVVDLYNTDTGDIIVTYIVEEPDNFVFDIYEEA